MCLDANTSPHHGRQHMEVVTIRDSTIQLNKVVASMKVEIDPRVMNDNAVMDLQNVETIRSNLSGAVQDLLAKELGISKIDARNAANAAALAALDVVEKSSPKHKGISSPLRAREHYKRTNSNVEEKLALKTTKPKRKSFCLDEVMNPYTSGDSDTSPKTERPFQYKKKRKPKKWTIEEDAALRSAIQKYGEKRWKNIATFVDGRDHVQCLQRWKKVLKPGLVRGHWSKEEDEKLRDLIKRKHNNWGEIAVYISGRTAKQCRERWQNHLDPTIKHGKWTAEEDTVILQMQQRSGNCWSQIASALPGRTDNAVKTRWKSITRSRGRAAKESKKTPRTTGKTNKPMATTKAKQLTVVTTPETDAAAAAATAKFALVSPERHNPLDMLAHFAHHMDSSE